MAMNATAIRFDESEKDWIQSYASVLGTMGGGELSDHSDQRIFR